MVHREVLPSGLTVLVRELPGAPAVALNLWVRSGSRDDPGGGAGTSHFLEHLLFRGRGPHGDVDLAREVQDLGGYLNGGTSVDHTAFYQIVSAQHWRRVLAAQAAVAMSPVFDRGDVDVERRIIVEEARSAEREPWSLLWRRTAETVFLEHPCRVPVLGTEETLPAITLESLLAHHARTYRAGNLVQVIVGDVDAREAVTCAEQVYGGLAAGASERDAAEQEPQQSALRACGLEGDLTQTYACVAYRTVPVLHPDAPALDALASLLGSGKSSRLSRSLRISRGLVSEVEAGHVGFRDAGVLVVRAVLAAGSTEDVLAEVFSEIERLRCEPASPAEMEKNRRRLEAGYAIEHETAESIAWTLGAYETEGDVAYAEEYVDRLAAVTQDDLLRVAREYLGHERASVLAYGPQSALPGDLAAAAARAALAAGATHAGRLAESRAGWQPAPFARPMVLAERGPVATDRRRLPGGGTLIASRVSGLPLVSVALGFRGGSALEPDDQAGVTYVLQKLLARGTTSLTASELADRMEGLGSAITTTADRDGLGLGATVLSKHLEEAVDLLSDVAAEPGLRDEDLENVRAEVLAEIGEVEDHPDRLAMLLLLPLVFPGHPYGRALRGTRDTVGRLDAASVRAWHARLCSARSLVLCLAGDIGGGNVPGSAAPEGGADVAPPGHPTGTPVETRPAGRADVDRGGAPQSTVAVGFGAPADGAADSPAARVLSVGLSMMGGRLWRALRERPPHAYSVHASYLALAHGGAMVVQATSQPGSEDQVVESVLREARSVVRSGLGQDELARARQHLAGGLEISLERRATRAAAYAMAEVRGNGYEWVDRMPELVRGVTGDDVARLAAGHVDPDRGFAVAVIRGKA